MKNDFTSYTLIFTMVVLAGCNPKPAEHGNSEFVDSLPFPDVIRNFTPKGENPVFKGTGEATWDKLIRERGYILKEDDGYHMWYTGFDGYDENTILKLGYAFSEDGFQWKRHENNPVFGESWVEDMMVWKQGDTYYMFAEGRGDIAKMLTSNDKIHWENQGDLDIRQADGSPLSEGPYGTPTVWMEDGTWYLFYERNDQGIWLATSRDLKVWTNVTDDPVITMGPEKYDQYGVAVNQIIKYKDHYYAYYHGTSLEDWSDWTMNMAISSDLVHWSKYPENPIMGDNKSSGITVHDGERFRFYTMHPEVVVHFPAK
ncbi:glycosylase [Cyclobacterium sp. SYSU L10401]|uniref:glycosylase n=1 Tax=Cyclobacterium sp. SYSU L10401 TaxID=2678657 RepID=UPI001969C759|nr:glycosylase [Cyclobacterium sp. SYSU L10401]